MMGWIVAFSLAALCLGTLYVLGIRSRQGMQMAGAAVLFALAGYAWQGIPEMPGSPVRNGAARITH